MAPTARVPVPIILLLLWMAGMGVAWVTQRFSLPAPECGLLKLTGIPCPFCGSTRSLAAWSRFDLELACSLNPLVALAGVAVSLLFVIWLLDCWFQRGWMELIRRHARRLPWFLALAAALLANWIYLFFFLPR
jgi:hypothetical protein